MFCGTDNIQRIIPHIQSVCEVRNILWYTVSRKKNTIMNLNNVMNLH